ncbi:response regulator transcription factor [soil metagenome]
MRIAILEDEPVQMQLLVAALDNSALSPHVETICSQFDNGDDLRRALGRETFDLLILDSTTEGMSSLDIVRWLRGFHQSMSPVIMLSARGSERDVAEALTVGANDYVIKPFRAVEMLARVNRFRPPQTNGRSTAESFGDWTFLHDSAFVVLTGPPEQLYALNEHDFDLALALFRNLGRVVSRFDLLEATHQNLRTMNTRILDNQIFKMRRRLALEANGLQLQTIYGGGYRLVQMPL